MKKKAFTIMEILIVVAIIGILATLGLPTYQNVIEDSKAKVCEINLEALNTGLEIYAMEHDVMPGDLSELTPEYIEKAYAHILQQEGAWKIKLAYYIVGWEQRGLAYAGLLSDISKGNLSLITCPADPTPPPSGVSYGLNSLLKNMPSGAYRNLQGDTLLIGDCETNEFSGASDLESRHRHYNILGKETYAKGITKDKKINKEKKTHTGKDKDKDKDKGKDNNNNDDKGKGKD